MIETGHSLSYVHKRDAGQLSGYTKEALIEIRDLVSTDIPDATSMLAALELIIASNPGFDAVDELERQGRYLLGAERGFHSDAPCGLLYAEAAEPFTRNSALTGIYVGTWVAADGTKLASNNGIIHEASRPGIRDALLNMGLNEYNEDSNRNWGVPVARTTRVIPLHPQPGDISEPYFYGHRQDLSAAHALKIPDHLKLKIVELLKKEHLLEIV